jgi:glycine/D-amino acid oxidase-like deaminating enzyme
VSDNAAEVVIVGAGVRGTAIAYYLARSGRDVLLIDRAELTSGATGANVGLVNASAKEPAHYTQLSLASCELYPDLERELDADLEYQRNGGLSVHETERELIQAEAFARQQNAVPGMKIELLTAREARELEPALTERIAGASYCATDGHVNPQKLGLAFGRAALRLGVRVWTRTDVHEVTLAQGHVSGVLTSRGTVRSAAVIDAAGVDVSRLARQVGLAVPVVPSRGQILVTEPIPPLVRRPVGLVTQSRRGNVLISGVEGFGGLVRRADLPTAISQARKATRLFPALRDIRCCRIFPALKPWPADGLPILGESTTVKGFFVATGHSGITLAPLTGRLMAELLSGAPSMPLEPYSLERFGRHTYRSMLDSFHRFHADWFAGDERERSAPR